MTKPNRILILSVLALTLALAPAFAQKAGKVDLAGIWTGFTLLGDGSRAEFNLTLEKAGDLYTGKITDEAGIIPEMQLKNVTFKDSTLAFEIDFPNGAGTQVIKVELKYEADTLKGNWVDPNGESNIIELGRKK
jgi:hypothetical protein